MPAIIQMITTINDRTKAEEIGRRLVGEKLAACCQITGPIRSIYRWKGKIEENDEWYIVMKTKESLYHLTEEAIRRMHPYEVPEIIAIPIVAGSGEYLEWLRGELM